MIHGVIVFTVLRMHGHKGRLHTLNAVIDKGACFVDKTVQHITQSSDIFIQQNAFPSVYETRSFRQSLVVFVIPRAQIGFYVPNAAQE